MRMLRTGRERIHVPIPAIGGRKWVSPPHSNLFFRRLESASPGLAAKHRAQVPCALQPENRMSHFQLPVEIFMSRPVHCVSLEDDLATVQDRLVDLSISSLAVVEKDSKLVGVISMTDLIRIGRRGAGSRGKSALLSLPQRTVADSMSREVVTLAPDEPIGLAAHKMVEGRFHRVFVEDAGKLVGIVSTRDVMLAIRDKRVQQPIERWMSSPVFTIRAQEPISLATERLERAHITGLVVVDNGWPVGIFAQREALESKDRERDTHVEEAMSPAILALETTTPLHRAAHQAAELRVRSVVAVHNRNVEGILSGLDFARAASEE